MAAEDFTPEPGRDLGPLIHALRHNGGSLAFVGRVRRRIR
jgi:hypothetical protein